MRRSVMQKPEQGVQRLRTLGYLYQRKEANTKEVAIALDITTDEAFKHLQKLEDVGLIEGDVLGGDRDNYTRQHPGVPLTWRVVAEGDWNNIVKLAQKGGAL